MNDQPLQDAMLRDLAQQLGVRAAERVDPEQTAQAVMRRLREPQHTPTRWQPLWLSAAATVALLLTGGLVWRSVRTAAPAPATVGQAALDLNDLSVDQLRDVLHTVEQPLDVDAGSVIETGIDDLTPSELRALLHTLEG